MGDKSKRAYEPVRFEAPRFGRVYSLESFPLVDFPLAFTALTTLKHLILITAKRLGSNVVLYVGFQSTPGEIAYTARARGSESYGTSLLRR